MEEIAALLIQLILEVGLQVLGSAGFDFATERRTRRTNDKGKPEHDGCGWLALFAFFGGACGVLSLIFVPRLIMPNLGLRVANLILAPLVAGGLSYLIARYVWAPRGQRAPHHFWRGFWFALAFGLVRFAYAHR